MKLTVYTNTDTAEDGPSLDNEAAQVGYYGDEADPADQSVRFAFSSSVPNIDSQDALDSGLWTVVLTMSPAEARNLANDLNARANAHAQAPSSAQLDDQPRGRLS